MTDLETLRRHEAALLRLFNRHAFTEDEGALGYALSRLREDIAKAEADGAMPCAACHGEEIHFDQCGACGGYGTRNGKPIPARVSDAWKRGALPEVPR